jgi:transcriptional regulator with XRE-family HTH domain
MPKLTSEYIQEGLKDDRKGKKLSITGKQISSLEGLESFATLSKVSDFDFSFNMIRSIPSSFTYPNLQILDLSTNLITKIEYLEELKSLQVLRLSRNRLNKIEGLSQNLALTGLDLSMNQIRRIENLSHLKQLKLLYLYGNSIRSLEGLAGLNKLESLRIEQNEFQDISHLATFEHQINELEAHSNRISDLDDVIKTLFKMNKVKKLSLYNNPIFNDVTYKFRILKYKNIEYLDGLLVKEYIREVLEDMKDDYDLDQIVVESQRNINVLIEREREVKDIAVKLLSLQMQRLDDDFIEFSKAMEK